ncbi:MAG: crotonase/enoyl-CoA hydratase family protein [Myxococcales bacterium]|nr:crotonase/enoyl-CoA hydratase family protein [Myxococcales bacterium]
MLDYSLRGDVAVLTMDDQKANALSHDMLDALDAALDRAEREAKALVIAGREGKFCAGFDLTTMMAGPESAAALLTKGGAWLLRLYAFPLPVVAACSGHALAGGALLLLCCDLRIGVEGAFKIGLNEVQIGMPLPLLGRELARDRIAPRHLAEATMMARIYAPHEAVEAGYLDRVVAPGELANAAEAAGKQLTGLSLPAYTLTKQRLREGTIQTIQSGFAADLSALSVMTST